jgi:hypothetical protein
LDGQNDCVTPATDTCEIDCNDDLTPDDCSDVNTPGCAFYDDCGVCSGGTTDHEENSDADCSGECFGDAEYDECDVCDGDNSSCNQPDATSQFLDIDEEQSIDLVLSGTDPNGDQLTFELISDPENGTLTGDVPNLTYTPNENFNGVDSFSFTVSDGDWTSITGSVTMTVNPVNDAPVIGLIDTQTINEDSYLELLLSATDIENDNLTFSASVDAYAQVDLDGTTLVVTPNLDFFGVLEVTVFVSDGDLTDETSFELTVISINDSIRFNSSGTSS